MVVYTIIDNSLTSEDITGVCCFSYWTEDTDLFDNSTAYPNQLGFVKKYHVVQDVLHTHQRRRQGIASYLYYLTLNNNHVLDYLVHNS